MASVVLPSSSSPAAREVVPSAVTATATATSPITRTAHFAETLDFSTFQRGNLHTHTSRSDGDRPPEDSYVWYRDHGYAFVAITDHNQLTPPEEFRSLERPGFTIIPGEEITMAVHGHPVHVNALCTKTAIGAVPDHELEKFPTVDAALRWAVAHVVAQDAVAMVNHPNFIWALTADDLPSAHGAVLLEIWSGHPYVHSQGDGTHPSEEAIWDTVLTRGETFAGVAVDDTHYIGLIRTQPRGLVAVGSKVFASEPTTDAICNALARGHLYSSSGATLRQIVLTADSLSVRPAQRGAVVKFIGFRGETLARAHPSAGELASYRLRGDEKHVGARIELPNGKYAWTEAYRVVRGAPP